MIEVGTTAPAWPGVDVGVSDDGRRRTALPAWARLAARPAGIYLASRAFVMAAVWLASRMPPPDSVGHMLMFWDGGWYVQAARAGYPAAVPMVNGHIGPSTLAFSPLFPLCIRVVHALGLSYETAGLLVANAAGIVAAVLLRALLQRMWGDEAADRGVALFCFFPGAFVLSGVYAEPLMLALSIGCLLALISDRWLVSGVLAGLATATTPHALALVPACAWAAAVAIRRRRAWGALAAPILAPGGFVAFQAFVWARTGLADAYPQTHHAWGARLDVVAPWHTVRDFVRHPLLDVNNTVATAGTLFLAIGLVLLVRARPPGAVVAYAVGVMVPVMVSDTLGARPRFLLVAFPLIVVLGRRLRGNAFTVALAGSASLLGCLTMLSVHTLLATP
jgi:hypothetical protein